MLHVRPLGYALGAEVTGVDLREPLSQEIVAEIRASIRRHIVLCFPGQPLEREHMLAFCGRFGALDDLSHTSFHDPAHPGVTILANKPAAANGKAAGMPATASLWHSDHSYSLNPNTFTFLCAKQLPEVGGNTMFANMYAAYEALSPGFKSVVESIAAVHDWSIGPSYDASTPEHRTKMMALNPPVVHPLVQVHPETGRKALYAGDRIRKFQGMTEEESRSLVDYCNRHAVRYEFTYRHRWTVDDVVMWDNRCSLHYAVQDYDRGQLRRMMRCSLKGPQTGSLYADAVPRTVESVVRA